VVVVVLELVAEPLVELVELVAHQLLVGFYLSQVVVVVALAQTLQVVVWVLPLVAVAEA
jgi:hypothetical protein